MVLVYKQLGILRLDDQQKDLPHLNKLQRTDALYSLKQENHFILNDLIPYIIIEHNLISIRKNNLILIFVKAKAIYIRGDGVNIDLVFIF